MTLNRIVPNMRTDNLQSMAQFYTKIFAMEIVMDHGWIITVADPERPELQFSFMQKDATAPVLPVVSIEVSNVDAVHEIAQSLKAEIIYELTDESWGVRRFFVRDPSGNVINILSHSK